MDFESVGQRDFGNSSISQPNLAASGEYLLFMEEGDCGDLRDRVIEDSSDSSVEKRVHAFLEDDNKIDDLLPEGKFEKMGKLNKFLYKHPNMKLLLGGALLVGSGLAFASIAVTGTAVVGGIFAFSFLMPPAAPVGLLLGGIFAVSFGSALALMGGVAGGLVTGVGLGSLGVGVLEQRFDPPEVKQLVKELEAAGVEDKTVQLAADHLRRAHHFRHPGTLPEKETSRRWAPGTDKAKFRTEMAVRIKYDPKISHGSKVSLLKTLVTAEEEGFRLSVEAFEAEVQHAQTWDPSYLETPIASKLNALLTDDQKVKYEEAIQKATTYAERCDVAYAALKECQFVTEMNVDVSDLEEYPLKARRVELLVQRAVMGKEAWLKRQQLNLGVDQLNALVNAAKSA